MEQIFFFYLLVLLDNISVRGNNVSNSTEPSPCSDEAHMFLAPGVLVSGSTGRACVSRFHTNGAAELHLSLVAETLHTTGAYRDLGPGDGDCIDITVPQLPNTKADLVVSVRYPEARCQWESRLPVRIGSGRVVAIYPERSRYKPGDSVRARLIVLKPDLTPSHSVIDEIWLEGPYGAWAGARAAEWRRVRSRLGVAQLHHVLDEAAPPGKWTLRARLADGSQGAAAFHVGNYELPPFQLSVRHAPKVLRTSERLVWTVCVRYPWTEAVEGMLVIRIRTSGAGASDSSPGIRTAVRLRAPRACHRHAAAARRVGLDGPDAPDVVVADFSFQEDGTRIWQNTTVVSQVVDKPYSLEFLTKQRAVISPGLPYRLKVKATRWDDRPAPYLRVRVCRTPIQHAEVTDQGECYDTATDDNGMAGAMFTAGEDSTVVYKFEATLHNDSSTYAPPMYLPVYRSGSLQAALGALKPDPNMIRTFVPLYLNSRNIIRAITAHFLVITRGGVIYRWGATTQCPITNSLDEIQTAARNGPCPIYETKHKENLGFDNSSDALLDRQLLRIMLPVKISHQMCPDSYLVAYFYYNGELVTTSKHFEMEECFSNKVEATWASRQTAPGSSIALHIKTLGPALCALTALDSAAKWIQPMENVRDVIISGLKKMIDGNRNLTGYDAGGDCFMTTDSPERPTSTAELTAIWLAAAGVRVVGANIPTARSCPAMPLPLTSNDVTVPRSDFSEAWLWRLVAIGTNGSVSVNSEAPDSITRYEASAVCVSRTGVAVTATPAVLQVFREFFIHADGPRRLRRGDSTIIRYRIFNYLYDNISVQIQILTDPHLEGPTDYVESACIHARASIARRVEVRARLQGNARVSIRAKSVKDGSCANLTTSAVGVSDEVIIQILVEPEGVPAQDQRSALLCGEGNSESSTDEIQWNWPKAQIITGTETLTVWAISDITGPLLADADSLILLPRGCGEQNMARMATNLLAMQQLDPQSTAAAIAREHVARGFTRQLQYVHPQGGFSAFGASDATPSTWLTAFVVRYLRKAHQSLTPDLPTPPALDRAERWLFNQQMENGCFRNEGQVFHRELRGGLNEDGETASVALTAYVITSLIESNTLSSRILQNALTCLRALPALKTKSPARVYGHTLLAYAFMRLKRYEEEVKSINEASLFKREGKLGGLDRDEEMMHLLEMLKLAKRSVGFVWWETGSLATSIEATGYALLALSRCPAELRASTCAADARAAIRWLSTHRNAFGGFVSTQDTLVALEALNAWISLKPSEPTNLTITAKSDDIQTSFHLEAAKIPEVTKMRAGELLTVKVKGSGCALVQATRSYNTYAADSPWHELLSVEVAVHTDGAFDCNGTSCYCAAVVEVCVMWSNDFPEMALLEVSLPGGFGADAARLYSQLNQPHVSLLRRIELSPTSSKAVFYLGTRDGSASLGLGGHQCYQIHAVGPQVKTKPAYARVFDYYRPSVNDTQMYTIPEECPSRITHESNQYVKSDNLFNKAKSLTDNDEIVITNEFSFEDIPEGTPLEDPLYDNMAIANAMKAQELAEKDVNMTSNKDLSSRKIVNDTVLTDSRRSASVKSDPNNIQEYNVIIKELQDKYEDIKSKIKYDNDSDSLNENLVNGRRYNKFHRYRNDKAKPKNSNIVVRRPESIEFDKKSNDLSQRDDGKFNNEEKAEFNLKDKHFPKPFETAKQEDTTEKLRNNKVIKNTKEDIGDKDKDGSIKIKIIFSDEKHNPNDNDDATDTQTEYKLDSLKQNPKISKILIVDERRQTNQKERVKMATQEDKEIDSNADSVQNDGGKEGDRLGFQVAFKGDLDKNGSTEGVDFDVNNETPRKNQQTPVLNDIKRTRLKISDKLNFESSFEVGFDREEKSFSETGETGVDAETGETAVESETGQTVVKSETEKTRETANEVDNPKLSDFHMIDSETDLAVPDGVEGPIPAVVAPPPSFVPRGHIMSSGQPYVTRLKWAKPHERTVYVIK